LATVKDNEVIGENNRRLKKLVSVLQKCDEDEGYKLSSEEGSSHFQDAMEMLERHHPKVVLALKSSQFTHLDLRNVLLLDNQSTFDLCCNKMFVFASKIIKVSMTSNGGGLKITEKCKLPGYKYLVWYSKKVITNIICLKNLIKCYRVTYEHLWSIAVRLTYHLCCLKCTRVGGMHYFGPLWYPVP